ncbi:histone deacetylase complex subunit SAP130-like [Lingula anatina]|uniref:Histone deacetylase complex subunit SAP130-like n=1 Tax=Lingula anatina TaxID=7574 RepID=A0A1S3I7Z8_LINAN|nr:histone deacetylase complex subunit SAP130-like [Lingula anatina]|eukprot:XP_013393499.1 histone deacetylase complex subunit SAP130-like [Lingula anatina]
MKIKTEPLEGAPIENGLLSVPQTVASVLQNNMEASPRKKPRKQLLNINEELKDSSTEDETETKPPVKEERETEIKPPMPKEYTDEEGVRWVAMRKRNTVTLMNSYHCTWKARNNHFLRASDVKPKDERRPTVNELSNQKSVIQKANGWKLYHLAAQLEEMMDLEKVVHSRIARLQKTATAKPDIPFTEEEVHKIKEQSQANKQRSQLFMDQLEEAKSSMLRILDHKPRIMEIINKHHSKRPVKKKERT